MPNQDSIEKAVLKKWLKEEWGTPTELDLLVSRTGCGCAFCDALRRVYGNQQV